MEPTLVDALTVAALLAMFLLCTIYLAKISRNTKVIRMLLAGYVAKEDTAGLRNARIAAAIQEAEK